ncbi:MAG: hypothetical protein P4L46_09215 [Fimbriimonas sp.]|nr:hypothetical protein [Fimbriimonas sp.]
MAKARSSHRRRFLPMLSIRISPLMTVGLSVAWLLLPLAVIALLDYLLFRILHSAWAPVVTDLALVSVMIEFIRRRKVRARSRRRMRLEDDGQGPAGVGASVPPTSPKPRSGADDWPDA